MSSHRPTNPYDYDNESSEQSSEWTYFGFGLSERPEPPEPDTGDEGVAQDEQPRTLAYTGPRRRAEHQYQYTPQYPIQTSTTASSVDPHRHQAPLYPSGAGTAPRYSHFSPNYAPHPYAPQASSLLPSPPPGLVSTSAAYTTPRSESIASASSTTSPPPLDVDIGSLDDAAAREEEKRRRNLAASARFRVKKKQKEQALERSARELTEKVAVLEERIQLLEVENGFLRGLLVEKETTRRKDKGRDRERERYGVGRGEGGSSAGWGGRDSPERERRRRNKEGEDESEGEGRRRRR